MRDALGRRLRAYANKDGRGYPDWAMRYVPIVTRLSRNDLLRSLILEIGANENGLARFVSQRVVAVDVNIDHLRACRASQNVAPVCADIGALPFADDTFAVVAAVDTLEHLPADARENACAEIVRVLQPSGSAAVAFPAGEAARRAEASVREAYRAYTGETLKWFEEHDEVGLPNPEAIRRTFEERRDGAHRVAMTRNGTLWIWRWSWRVMMCGWPGFANAAFQAALRAVTPFLCRIHVGPCYRRVIWLEPKR